MNESQVNCIFKNRVSDIMCNGVTFLKQSEFEMLLYDEKQIHPIFQSSKTDLSLFPRLLSFFETLSKETMHPLTC